MQQAIQKERVGGFKDFIAEVQSGAFPAKEHVIEAPDGLVAGFLEKVEKGG
jgi:3-methyl-2-oxobutanoate hydroxymethyltransferase